jgi:hypothetical protein
MKASSFLLVGLLAVLAAPALAQPVVNGTRAGDGYGTAVSAQLVETQFGDNASELNAAWCTISSDRLYLMLTGNLENNFNKIELFIDSKAGGESVLSGNPGNDGAFRMAGLTFDAGFQPDYHIIVRRGFSNGNRFDIDFAILGTSSYASWSDVFGGTQEGMGATSVTGLNSLPIEVGFDNSNVAGVVGGTGPSNLFDALAVQTGFEVSVGLIDLGYLGGDIRALAFINNADHNYASNQFLGPLQPPHGNMGGDGNGTFTGVINFDLSTHGGNQFFTCEGRAVPAERATWGRIKSNYR